MRQNEKKRRYTIAFKASVTCTLIVLLLLSISSFISINSQLSMADLILSNFENGQKKLLEKDSAKLEQELMNNLNATLEICQGVAEGLLYNWQPEAFDTPLKSFMKIDAITAIKILDTKGKPFAASWRSPDTTTGEKIPDAIQLDESLSIEGEAVHENEKVGIVRIYFNKNAIVEQLETRKDQTQDSIEQFNNLFGNSINNSIIFQVIASTLIVVALIITIVFCMKVIVSKPIRKTANMVKDIAQGEGDLTRRLKIRHNDEIGELSGWFNMFLDTLHSLIKRVSESGITVNTSADELSKISSSMAVRVKNLSDRSRIVAQSSEEMSSNMASVASSSEQASTNIEVVAVAAEQMTNTINDIAQSSEKARIITSDAVKKSNEALQQVNNLGASAKDITKVTETITEISSQINLLALNANIEAARAGEAGKGFAVVANEIKELAGLTSKATLEIKDKIKHIQNSTNISIEQIREISEIIEEISKITHSIASSMEEQSSATKEIAQNVSQASVGLKDVNESVAQSSILSEKTAKDIAEIDKYTFEISESGINLDSRANELLTLADELKTIIGKFKI